ncbi:hypothetical protein HCA64_11860 [Listeria booriae]|uniref:Uncharacterized protein n=1 Tax=Listeria booriae TaxID=1552123 RepID=A0A099W4D3_9LIST|nr:hypothetical protein [Listeria booriae]KGL39872.1 hypothetical protein EP57_12485 [Listeria booriae]MBC1907174.1 hypothetical protein [Listeria booriae]STY40394.1 Uncharacterised protein [Listeria booriae]
MKKVMTVLLCVLLSVTATIAILFFVGMLDNTEENQTQISKNEQKNPQQAENKFNQLPDKLQALLIATAIDERSIPPINGVTVYYNEDSDYTLINVHSGAGVGHPIYLLTKKENVITPIKSVVYQGVDGYEKAEIKTNPISKNELYAQYIADKYLYDTALEKTEQNLDLTLADFNEKYASTYSDNTIDTTKLSEEQVKKWVNAIMQNRFENHVLKEFPYTISISLDENRHVKAQINVANSEDAGDSVGYFKINDKGQLVEPVLGADYDEVIATEYMQVENF